MSFETPDERLNSKFPVKRIHIGLTLYMLGNFSCFCFHLLTFFSKLTFSKASFRNTIRVSNSLDPDQDQHIVGPDLGPNCLQRLSADDKSPLAKKRLIKDKDRQFS